MTPMLTVSLAPEIEHRISERATMNGVSVDDFLKSLIEAGLDDLDDVQMAADRLSHPLPTLTGDQARKALGLDD
jgi:hypothetical protein